MSPRIAVIAMTAASVFFSAAPLLAAEDTAFSKDLKATIALQGMPCDQIVDAKRNADSDYVASCKDGNRYHIYVDDKGRVIVQKL